jgi:hypothetical protein
LPIAPFRGSAAGPGADTGKRILRITLHGAIINLLWQIGGSVMIEAFKETIDKAKALLAAVEEAGEVSDERLDEIEQLFEAAVSAVQFVREQREEARQAAATQGREARTEI